MNPGCVNEWKKLMVDLWESGETEDAADGVRVCFNSFCFGTKRRNLSSRGVAALKTGDRLQSSV